MCGITGFASIGETLYPDRLLIMRDSLAHRGPDDAGIRMFVGRSKKGFPSVGLAHRRLAIVDLTAAGRQPLQNEDSSVWITYNGECYNYQSLLLELQKSGHCFRSKTDTEVLIHGFEEWGIKNLLEKLNGMFAFAIWDKREEALVLARDRMGKKPFYYVLRDNGTLIFASEIKALIAGGYVDQDDIDEAALLEFWLFGYNTGERTIFRQVKRLLPGHYGIWKDGQLSTYLYWNCNFATEEEGVRTTVDYCDELEELLEDSVKLRMIADVPVGLFLSGGVDSSLIAAIASKVTGNNINSFTIAFEEAKFDESEVAREVAGHLGIKNSSLLVQDDMEGAFPAISRHFDELFGDSSAIPTYFVSKMTKQHVTVALTGDAGDELFGGYDAYAKALSYWGAPAEKKLFRGRVSLFQYCVDWYRLHCDNLQDKRSALENGLPLSGLKKVFTDDFLRRVDWHDVLFYREQYYPEINNADLLSQLQHINIKTYLPDDILVKVDRMSMAHSLECRSPFLDYRIVEFASRLPFSMKIGHGGEQKYILKKLLSRYLPEELINRPKMGFSIPWSEWCQGSLGRQLHTDWKQMETSYFRPQAAKYLFPIDRLGWPERQWNAFCCMNLFNQ